MAINGVAFHPKAFRMAIQAQTALGAALTNGMQEINIDSFTTGTWGGINNYDVKSGGGRILQDEHYFHQNSDYVSEITVSGIYSTQFAGLIENITADTSEVFEVASNYGPTAEIRDGASALTAANHELLTLALLPPKYGTDATPSATDGFFYKDCVVTDFSLSGDMATDGGLVRYSATFKTKTPVSGNVDASGYTIAAYLLNAANTLTISDWQDSAYRIIGGQADSIVNSFSLNLGTDAIFLGRQAAGVPEVISRQGEFPATADFNIKYDPGSRALFETWSGAAPGVTSGKTLMSNASTPATGASWGFEFPQSVFTNMAYSEGDIMNIDVSTKMVGFGAGEQTVCLKIAD